MFRVVGHQMSQKSGKTELRHVKIKTLKGKKIFFYYFLSKKGKFSIIIHFLPEIKMNFHLKVRNIQI